MLPPALPNSKPHGKVNETQFFEYFSQQNILMKNFRFKTQAP
jgi:hypothetical protein